MTSRKACGVVVYPVPVGSSRQVVSLSVSCHRLLYVCFERSVSAVSASSGHAQRLFCQGFLFCRRECLGLLRANASNWEALSSSATPIPLLGQAVIASEVKTPFLHLVDGSGSPVPRAGSKAAEILSSYSHSTLTTVDLTALVSRTQLTRARRGSQQSATRRSET